MPHHNYSVKLDTAKTMPIVVTTWFVYEKIPSYAGIRFDNALSLELKSINEFTVFKRDLYIIMINKALYSFGDFFIKFTL